jgi:Polyketide cyclase / dehydrase and lipid transport
MQTPPLFRRSDVVFAIGCGVGYGVVAQVVARLELLKGLFAVMSFGYVFVLPWVLGYVTATSLAPGRRWWQSGLAAMASVCLSLVVALAVGWEGSICLVMAAPVYLPLALLGGLVGHRVRRSDAYGARQHFALIALVTLPLGSAAIESRALTDERLRDVHDSIEIAATPEAVWPFIARVAAITEPQESPFFWLGFPKPVEATLSFEGVGGVRHARFERGLTFIETVHTWDPPRALGFGIEVDPAHTPLTTLDAHVTVGGRYFDVLDGAYRIEPIGPRRVRLHLTSRHRISTHFNAYTALWSDALMSEIQSNILRVLKGRVERAAAAP